MTPYDEESLLKRLDELELRLETMAKLLCRAAKAALGEEQIAKLPTGERDW